MQILVLGMHRSGTSALARLLNMMGCYFGDENVMARAARDNPKGFWERLDVVWANDELLRAAGGCWWAVDWLSCNTAAREPLAKTQEYLAQILLKLDAHRPWFLKDPRLCLTLEHWLPLLECPVFIHVQRSPAQVAQSLFRRNGIPLEYGARLWEFYTRSLLRILGDRPRVSVRYEDLLSAPHQTVTRLHAALAAAGVSGLRLPERAEVESFVDPGLQHCLAPETAALDRFQLDLLAALDQGGSVDSDPRRMETLRRELSDIRTGSPWADDLARRTVPISQLDLPENRVLALEASLKRLHQSRLVRIAAAIARLLGRTDQGLVPELQRVEELLALPRDKPVRQENPGLLRRVLPNPHRLLRLLHPRRVTKGLLLLASGREGLRQLGERLRLHLRGHGVEAVQNIQRHCLPLIQRYGLPRKSTAGRPGPATNEDVQAWSRELRLLAKDQALPGLQPAASIIIPVHNQIRFTLACLHSLYLNAGRQDFEILIADDASSDQTREVFAERFPRLRYLRSDENLGFLRTCNRAAREARGRHIVLLNNDTVVLPGWLSELLRTFDEHPGTGLAGSKLLYPEGALQEAGGIVFEDGGAWNYGRLEDPADPRFSFARDADYCSGASVAVDAELWRRLGGFDERFAPAYYEDTDLAFKVRAAGRRVIYQPCSEVVHFEGVSNGTSEASGVKRHQALNKTAFRAKWAGILAGFGPCDPLALPVLRGVKRRILVVDSTTPTPDKDSGSIDACNLMRIFQDLGFHVTFLPESCCHGGRATEDLQRAGVECLYAPWTPSPRKGLRRYGPDADIVLLARVGVAASLLATARRYAHKAKVWFDTVDLHFLRESREAALRGSASLARMADRTKELELGVIAAADLTLLRSEHELEMLRQILPGSRLLHMPIMRHIPGPGPTPWEERRDIVFIGGYAHPPNVDAVKHFAADVMPLLRARGFPGHFIIAGSDPPAEVLALAAPDVEVRGFVEDLAALFASCRLTVAPLRFGAGMKGKVVSSLTHGVPCVASPMAVEGSRLVHNEHLLVAGMPEEMVAAISTLYGDKELWLRLSEAGLRHCEEFHSIAAASRVLAAAVEEQLGLAR